MIEEILLFGENKSLFGIASIPTCKKITGSQYGVIILNSGLIHRVGPYRLNVDIARHLSKAGLLVFRFDLPGIGDSPKEQTRTNYQQSVIEVISAAMDAVSAKYQIDKFVSLGNCSGAMNSHSIANADPRICGAVLLDAYTYPTPKYWLLRFRDKFDKLFVPSKILGKLTLQFNRVNKKVDIDKSKETPSNDISYWNLPPKSTIEKDLMRMMQRDVRLLYIFTGGLKFYYNHREQHRSAFKRVDFKDNLELHYLEKFDHTYSLDRDKQVLLGILTKWIGIFK